MELLIETYTAKEAKIITESVNNGKDVYLSGRFLSGGLRNKNNRIYPVNEIKRAVNTLNEIIHNQGSACGELDHPQNRLNTELKYVSHIITEIRMNGDHGDGKMKIIDTPYGLIVKELIKNGHQPQVSSRGAGSVNEDGIVEQYMIQTIDIVSTASGIGCTPVTIYEHLDGTKSGRESLNLAEIVKDDPKAQKYFEREILKFFDILQSYK